jgi:hypothetical protein
MTGYLNGIIKLKSQFLELRHVKIENVVYILHA